MVCDGKVENHVILGRKAGCVKASDNAEASPLGLVQTQRGLVQACLESGQWKVVTADFIPIETKF
jgi:hypothetical protein